MIYFIVRTPRVSVCAETPPPFKISCHGNMPLKRSGRCSDPPVPEPASAESAQDGAAAAAAEVGGQSLELEINELGPAGEHLGRSAKHPKLESATGATCGHGDGAASSAPAPEAEIRFSIRASPACSDDLEMENHSLEAEHVPAERLDDKVTTQALQERGAKVVLAPAGRPVTSGEDPVAEKVTNELLLLCVEAAALILSLHGTRLKQLDGFKRASKEKVLAYLVLDAVRAPLVDPDEAERVGKRVHERVRTVNESIVEVEKFAKAKSKKAESDEARAAVATERQADLDALLTAEYAGISTAPAPPAPAPLPPKPLPPPPREQRKQKLSYWSTAPCLLPPNVSTPCPECGEQISEMLDDVLFMPIEDNLRDYRDVDACINWDFTEFDYDDDKRHPEIKERAEKLYGSERCFAETRLLLHGLVNRKMLNMLRDVEQRAAREVDDARCVAHMARVDAWDDLAKRYFRKPVHSPPPVRKHSESEKELYMQQRMHGLRSENRELKEKLRRMEQAAKAAGVELPV